MARFLHGGSIQGQHSGEDTHFDLLPWLPTSEVGPTTVVTVETRHLEVFLCAVGWIWG